MAFSNPLALVLLLAIPYFAWLGWPRVAYRRRRDLVSLVIRLVIVMLLILSIAGLQTVQAADKLTVVFLIDSSDSIDSAARAQAENYVRDAMSHMGPEDRAGVVVFGKNALVERPVSSVKELGPVSSKPVQLDRAEVVCDLPDFLHRVGSRLANVGDLVQHSIVILGLAQGELGPVCDYRQALAQAVVQLRRDPFPFTLL